MEGLRERKKRETRDAIAAAAMQLFVTFGFDAVTVAEVARAADVSEKTVFNHFATKEDLVLYRMDDRLAERVEAIRMRVPGVPLTRIFEAETMAFLDVIESGEIDMLMAVPRLVRGSASLRGRLLQEFEHEASELTAAVGEDDDDLIAATVVRSLVWAHRLVFREAFRRLMAGEHPLTVAPELRIEARRVYSRLERGLAGYGG